MLKKNFKNGKITYIYVNAEKRVFLHENGGFRQMKTVFRTGDVDTIVSQVAEELQDCTLIIFGADDDRFEDIVKKLHKSTPNAKKLGTTGMVFHKDGCEEAGISAMGFYEDEVEFYLGTMRRIAESPIKYLPGLIWSARECAAKYDNNICIEFTTGSEERIVSTMKVALEESNIKLLGGTPGKYTEGPRKIASNGKVMTDCTAYAVIGFKQHKVEVFKEDTFILHKQNHVVTKVSEDNRTVLTIDNRPAIDVYKEETGYTDANIHKGVFNNPLSRVVGEENYMVAIECFNPDGSITTRKNLQKNDMICVTDLNTDYKQAIRNYMDNISAGKQIDGIFSVNDVFRYQFFKENGFVEEYAKLMDRAANGCHLGVVGDGEQYVEQHVNQSMVCAVFSK